MKGRRLGHLQESVLELLTIFDGLYFYELNLMLILLLNYRFQKQEMLGVALHKALRSLKRRGLIDYKQESPNRRLYYITQVGLRYVAIKHVSQMIGRQALVNLLKSVVRTTVEKKQE